MVAEVSFGKRILLFDCKDRKSCKIGELFLSILFRFERDVSLLMDRLGVPEQIYLNFKKGKGDLEGLYHVQDKNVLDFIIAIDVFTRNLDIPRTERGIEIFQENLLDTFIHELYHHKYRNEMLTRRKAGLFIMKLLKKI